MIGVNLIVHLFAAGFCILAIVYFLRVKKDLELLQALLRKDRREKVRALSLRGLILALQRGLNIEVIGVLPAEFATLRRMHLQSLAEFLTLYGVEKIEVREKNLALTTPDIKADPLIWSKKLSDAISFPIQVILDTSRSK